LRQFVYVIDFGLTVEPFNDNSPAQSTDLNDTTIVESRSKVSNFIYQPYITNVIQDNLRIKYKSRQLDVQKGYKKVQRKIVMTMTNVRKWFYW